MLRVVWSNVCEGQGSRVKVEVIGSISTNLKLCFIWLLIQLMTCHLLQENDGSAPCDLEHLKNSRAIYIGSSELFEKLVRAPSQASNFHA